MNDFPHRSKPLKVALFGQSGPYAPVVLRRLLSRQNHGWALACVVEGLVRAPADLHRWQPPRPGPLPQSENLRDLANAAGLPVLQTGDVNASPAAQALRGFDVLICAGFDRLFGPALCAATPHALNAHPSLLPEWRGPSPIFWALRTQQKRLGISVHAIDARADHGPVFAQESFALPARATGEAIFRLAGQLAGQLLATTLDRLACGALLARPQDHAAASFAPRPKADHAQIHLPDWHCEALVNFACGAPFFRTPWMRLGNETFFIRRGIRAEPGRRLPGEFVQRARYLSVQGRDGVAHLEIN